MSYRSDSADLEMVKVIASGAIFPARVGDLKVFDREGNEWAHSEVEVMVGIRAYDIVGWAEDLIEAGLDVQGQRDLEDKEPWRRKSAGFWDAVAVEVARIEAEPRPAFWSFDSSGEAYDACQCNARIKSGDLLVIESEGVVGMAWAWPVAISENSGELHEAKDHKVLMSDDGMGASADQFRAAVAKVRALGLQLHPAFSYEDL